VGLDRRKKARLPAGGETTLARNALPRRGGGSAVATTPSTLWTPYRKMCVGLHLPTFASQRLHFPADSSFKVHFLPL